MAPSGKKMKRRRAEETDGWEIEDNKPFDSAAEPSSKRPKTGRSLFVRSLPPNATNETLTEFFSQHFPVKHATVVVDRATKSSKGFGFVSLADEDDAQEAKKKLDNELWDGRRIRVDVAEPRHRKADRDQPVVSKVAAEKLQREEASAEARKTKLIIRNLPWSIKKPEQLQAHFQMFGKVLYADLPQHMGKLKGFGFVTIRGKINAQKAMDTMNGKKIDGRTIAVDWAVEKSEWEQRPRQEGNGESRGTNDEAEGASESPNSLKPKNLQQSKSKEKSQLDADLENFMKTHFQNLEEEDSEKESEEDGGDEEDRDEDAEPESPAAKKPTQRTTDNSSTIFVRNLVFTATEGDLKSHFSSFGPVRYARIVKDKTTGRPAGTAFVCFFKEEDSRTCVLGAPKPQKATPLLKHSVLQDESADADGRYTMDGRLLLVTRAVAKEDAARLAASGGVERREKDKRRLFLLNEGHIDSRSPTYALLTPGEIKIRETSAAQRKKLVEKNPTLHLSLTRLAIRNISKNIGSKELKELARKAVVGFAKEVKEGRRQPLSKEELAREAKESKESEHQRKLKGKGVVTQAKIVFETNEGSKVPEKAGGGRSRGYGFIEYSSHRWALMGLRWLNGHQVQDSQGKKQRLIVEFAIENAQVVNRRRDIRSGRGRPNGDETMEVPESKKDGGKASRKWGKGLAEDDHSSADGHEDPRQALQQKLIARKRMVRKKKAKARQGK